MLSTLSTHLGFYAILPLFVSMLDTTFLKKRILNIGHRIRSIPLVKKFVTLLLAIGACLHLSPQTKNYRHPNLNLKLIKKHILDSLKLDSLKQVIDDNIKNSQKQGIFSSNAGNNNIINNYNIIIQNEPKSSIVEEKTQDFWTFIKDVFLKFLPYFFIILLIIISPYLPKLVRKKIYLFIDFYVKQLNRK